MLPYVSNAQNASHSGTDFWFVRYVYWDRENITLYITSAYTTSGKVELNLLNITHFSEPFSVSAGGTVEVKLPRGISTAMVGHVEMRGVHITSEKPVEVSAHCTTAFDDATVTTVLPTSALGYEYFAINDEQKRPEAVIYNGDFMVLAVEDNTLVEITSKFSLSTNQPANVPFTVRLKAGEMYRMSSPNTDLSGSRIRSISEGTQGRKKIAVFTGAVNQASQQLSYRIIDQYYQQLYPVRLWGQEYLTTPILNKGEEMVFKVVAAHCNTKVSFNGAPPVTIDQGQVYKFSSKEASRIVADKPVSVGQYFQSGWNNLVGDPETIMLTPVEQAVKGATVSSLAYTNMKEHFINVVIPTAHVSSFRLDGSPVSFTPVPSTPAYSYAVLGVSPGNHTLKADKGFNAIAYGTSKVSRFWERAESYGFAVGADKPHDIHQEITVNSDLLCGGSTISFSNRTTRPTLSWLWHFGDGTTSTEKNPTHTYAEPGTYEVTLTTVGNDVYNCNSEMATSVEVEVYSKVKTTASSTTECQGNKTRFEAVSTQGEGPEAVIGWRWSFGDGATSTEQNPTHAYAAAGTYEVTLTTSTAAGCTEEVKLPAVTVQALPQAVFGVPAACQASPVAFRDNSSIVNGNIVSWLWDFGDGTTSVERHPSHTFASAGDYQVSLTVTTENQCANTATKTVTVRPNLQANFQLSGACAGKEATFTNRTVATANTTYHWDLGDGTTSTLTEPAHTYREAGTYRVALTATSTDGCSSSETKDITIFPLPQADFTPTSACATTSFTFQGRSSVATGLITGWKWDFGDGSTSVAQQPSHTYARAGDYTVRLEVTSDKGCSSFVERQVKVTPQLIATAGQDQLLPYGALSTTLDANNPLPATGKWTVVGGTRGTFSNTNDPKATFTGTAGQTYTLRWTVASTGCGDVYDEVQVKLSVLVSEHLKIPNGISPNGDGINDTWMIEGIEAFPDVQIKVHNRWGDEVYRSRGYKTYWDGTRNGVPLPDGAYYYLIVTSPGAEVLKGSLTILR